jgi:AraC-like DNA-binding protein
VGRIKQNEEHNTSIAGWSIAIADALRHYGHDANDVFSTCGIELNGLQSPQDRLPVERVQRVWQYAESHCDDAFGLVVAQALSPVSLHALGAGLWCSANLQEFFERYIRYRSVLSHSHFCELVEDEDGLHFRLVDERPLKSEITHEAALGFLVRVIFSTLGPDFSPLALNLTRPSSPALDEVARFFNTTVNPASATYSLVIDEADMRRPMRYANPELARELDAIVEHYIAEHGLISEYMLRVRNTIEDLLLSGEVSLEAVAQQLHVTPRTLQRRLADESSSYHDVLEGVRRTMAERYALDRELSATEIAARLGFADSGSFSRSFRRWTGSSFAAYRKARGGGR